MNSRTSFANTIQRQDVEGVRNLLQSDPSLRQDLNNPMEGEPFGTTALLRAVSQQNREMVDLLLDAGADPNRLSDWWAGGFGVLDDAPRDLAFHLIERGARLTPHAAARLGLLDQLQTLLDEDPNLVHARGGDGQTPLHYAANGDVARLLLFRGARIDERDIDHESTPAQYMLKDRQDVARYLVDQGCQTDLLMTIALGDIDRVRRFLDAEPNLIRITVSDHWFPKRNPHSGGTIYTWVLGSHASAHQVARDFAHPEILELLNERSSPELRLTRACQIEDEATVNALLAADPHLTNRLSPDDGRALPDAAQLGHHKALALLLRAGWPLDARGQHGATALHWAAWHGDLTNIEALLQHKAPLEIHSVEWNITPLEWALHGSLHGWRKDQGDYPGVVRALRQAGALITDRTRGMDASPSVRKALNA